MPVPGVTASIPAGTGVGTGMLANGSGIASPSFKQFIALTLYAVPSKHSPFSPTVSDASNDQIWASEEGKITMAKMVKGRRNFREIRHIFSLNIDMIFGMEIKPNFGEFKKFCVRKCQNGIRR
jgi:hypothetical protein